MEEHKNTKKESGQSLVELALSMVLLLTLLAGLVDLGRAFFTYIALRDAAQEGASYASVAKVDPFSDCAYCELTAYCSAIETRARSTSSNPVDLTTGDITVQTLINGTECASISPANVCMGGAVTVSVSYDNFPITMPFMGAILGRQTLTLSTAAVDTILTPACQ